MVHSALLYTLLALWLLPAIALMAVYCADVLRDRVRQLWMRWTCYRTQQMLAARREVGSLVDARKAVTLCRPKVAQGPAGQGWHAASDTRFGRPYLVRGDTMQVPLVLEDETGELRMQQWELSLN